MRKDDEGSTFGDIAMDYRLSKAKKTFLSDVSSVIDFTKIERKLKKKYSPKNRIDGAPPYPPLMMFKILLLQQWYKLSDYETEELLVVRLDFMRFVDLSMESEVPDHSTICRFRNAVLELNLYEKLLNEINNQLEKLGLLVKKGAIVDASIVESSRRPRKVVEEIQEDRKESNMSELDSSHTVKYSGDTDAKWLKKGRKFHYGYKVHVSVDAKDGFILGGHTTPANVSDTVELENVIDESSLTINSFVLADKGYSSKSNREMLKAKSLKDGIMGKAVKNKPLTEAEMHRNRLISKYRYKVERTFGTLKQHYRFNRARYLGKVKVNMEFHLNAMAHNIKKATLMVQ